MIIVVDDLRNIRQPGATTLRNSREAVVFLKKLQFDYIDSLWLDHDLGVTESGIHDTINPVVEMLAEAATYEKPFSIGMIYVHTSNPSGATMMMTTLQKYGYNVRRVDATKHFD